MTALVTGAPGSGKTTLVAYAKNLGDERFSDSDEIPGLCEWREFETGKVLGLVSDFPQPCNDEWYKKYGWYWKLDLLKEYISKHPKSVVCGSAENVIEAYYYFDRIFIFKKTSADLRHNLESSERKNPFGKTPYQRKDFIRWQSILIAQAKPYHSVILRGSSISDAYDEISGCKDSDS